MIFAPKIRAIIKERESLSIRTFKLEIRMIFGPNEERLLRKESHFL